MRNRSVGARALKRRSRGPASRTAITIVSNFHLHASSLTSRRATRVLANGDSFAVFEVHGDIVEARDEPLGFFHRDTRYLSRFELSVAAETPYYLNGYRSQDNAQLQINLSNPDLGMQGRTVKLPKNSIQIERDWVIADSSLFHRVSVRNYSHLRVRVPLELLFAADFADLFEVRGFKRTRRGRHSRPEVGRSFVKLSYAGVDGLRRYTEIKFQPQPASLEDGRASFILVLEPDGRKELEVRISGGTEERPAISRPRLRFENALEQRRSEIAHLESGWSAITTSHQPLDVLLRRSYADLVSIIRHAPEGMFMMAGIPWFATLFGRDSILTALFALPFNPELSRGTLKTLAALQGSEVNPRRDEQPGKIVHEIRNGELAASGEVPFGRYYGSADATPLFLLLLGRYVAATGDLELADRLWPNAERALNWIERWGDQDGDLYVEYLGKTPHGLANQGWKDSFDAISHADGTLAKPPIALCEIQGYVYAAYVSMAGVAKQLGHENTASRLSERAQALRSAFSRDFWLERERTVALALDADKKPCRVMTSNAGHCLAAGLLDPDQAEALAGRLTSGDMFTGWGVRTLSAAERRFNPMSYHNGSVWPHDNAIVAAGLAQLKGRRGAVRVLEGLLQASTQLKTGSLPELFCGFSRDKWLGPVPYPVACHPQAWSAASIFMIIQAMLGIEAIGSERRLVIDAPAMPEWLDWIKLEHLKVADAAVSLLVRRTPEVPAIEILDKHGDVAVELK